MTVKTGTTGSDTLYGGAGGDQLVGLAGDDVYGVYSSLDTVVEQPNEGNDRVLTFASYALLGGSSVETLSTAINAGTDPIALTGNELSQFVIGNYGSNTIDGGGGGDALIGLRGDDVYRVHGRTDFVIENSGEGTDRVLTSGDFILNVGSSVESIAVETSARTSSLLLGGNELAQSITGGLGNDTLNSGGGADTLDGGLGNDTYRLFGGETVNEGFGAGSDQIFTSGSIALPSTSAVESISTAVNAGTEAINLTGSSYDQVIIGNYGNNVIDGGGGSDTLIGLRGDDSYRVYGNGALVLENAGEGNDTIFTSGNYVLRQGASVETLSTARNADTTPVSLTGNDIANVLVGNYGLNVLDGGAGNDTIYGLQGNDVFQFSTALGNGNVDTLVDFGNGADTIRLDLNVFTGLTAGSLAASAIAVGSAAGDANDRIIYNAQTGALLFDSDGTGATAAIQFATLPTGLAASQIVVNVADVTNPSGAVNITTGGTFLVGGATGDGTSLATAYPRATSFVLGDSSPQHFSYPADLVFGPDSVAAQARTPISFTDGFAVGGFNFSQLGTGVVLRPTTDFLTTSGQTIIGYPPVNGTGGPRPSYIIGSGQGDYLDASLHAGESDPTGGPRIGPALTGGAGDDTLIGGRSEDGGIGNDTLVGYRSTQMVGGAGSDLFELPINTLYASIGNLNYPNTAVDYDPSVDRLQLILNTTTDLQAGTLDASRFAIDTRTTSDQRIIYHSDTGDLSLYIYQTGAERIFAHLPAHLDLTAANFTVVGPG